MKINLFILKKKKEDNFGEIYLKIAITIYY
jgi:hypothetical protein